VISDRILNHHQTGNNPCSNLHITIPDAGTCISFMVREIPRAARPGEFVPCRFRKKILRIIPSIINDLLHSSLRYRGYVPETADSGWQK
jgi:hypothetical protein